MGFYGLHVDVKGSDLPADNDNMFCSSCRYWFALDVGLAAPSFYVGFSAGDVD